LGRVEEAIDLYERAVEGAFDSTGPYDRLIHIYADRAQHHDVIRIAEAALGQVRTYEEKRTWYTTMRDEARRRAGSAPKPAPRQG
ncbi:MAG: hypothetical protein ACLGHL_09940, partial [Actinomycetota bacterium]